MSGRNFVTNKNQILSHLYLKSHPNQMDILNNEFSRFVFKSTNTLQIMWNCRYFESWIILYANNCVFFFRFYVFGTTLFLPNAQGMNRPGDELSGGWIVRVIWGMKCPGDNTIKKRLYLEALQQSYTLSDFANFMCM